MVPYHGFLIDRLLGLAVYVFVFLVLFLIFRAVVLWYWKLDKIEEHLRAIRKALDK